MERILLARMLWSLSSDSFTRPQPLYGGNDEESVPGDPGFSLGPDGRSVCTDRQRRHDEHRSGQGRRRRTTCPRFAIPATSCGKPAFFHAGHASQDGTQEGAASYESGKARRGQPIIAGDTHPTEWLPCAVAPRKVKKPKLVMPASAFCCLTRADGMLK